jgi:hypothetical protein
MGANEDKGDNEDNASERMTKRGMVAPARSLLGAATAAAEWRVTRLGG